MPAIVASPKTKKITARAALVAIDGDLASVLSDCFRQFGIQTVAMPKNAPERFHNEKFEACVVHLDEHAEPVLQAVRSSRWNMRAVIYGIAASAQDALRFSKYGINAVFAAKADRAAALKIVRSTYFLVQHEFRRYVRVPLTAEVRIEAPSGAYSGIAQEMSGGGMSVEVKGALKQDETAELFFSLPGGKAVKVNAIVCWINAKEGLAGFRFDMTDERRAPVKQWIEDYLEIG